VNPPSPETVLRSVARVIRAELAKLPEDDLVTLAREKLEDGTAQLEEAAAAIRRETKGRRA
jgi:hypothetical protein